MIEAPLLFLPKLIIPAMTFPFSMHGKGCVPLEETVFPSTEISNTGVWVETNAFNMADATNTFGDDGEFGQCPEGVAVCPAFTSKQFRVTLNNPEDIDGRDSSCQGMRMRIRVREDPFALDPGCVEINLVLQQGTTTIRSFTDSSFGTSLTTLTDELTDAQVDSITNHFDLNYQCTGRVGLEDNSAKSGPQITVSGLDLVYFAK